MKYVEIASVLVRSFKNWLFFFHEFKAGTIFGRFSGHIQVRMKLENTPKCQQGGNVHLDCRKSSESFEHIVETHLSQKIPSSAAQNVPDNALQAFA